MRRGNLGLVIIVVLASTTGGAAAVDLGQSFATKEVVPLLQQQIDTEVTGATLSDDRFRIDVTVSNPTRYPVSIAGGFIQVYDDRNDTRLVYGAVALDDRVTVPADSRKSISLSIALTPSERRALNRSIPRLVVQHQYATRFRTTDFVLRGDETIVEVQKESG